MFNTHLISDHNEKRSTGVASRACAWFAAVGIGLSFVLGQTALAQSQLYAVTDLGTLESSEICPCFFGKGINEFGHVTGFYFGADGNYHAFYWADGTMIDLGTLGGDVAFPLSVNGSNAIVGWSRFDVEVNAAHAFLYSDGAMIDLGTFGGANSTARDINNAGLVVGNAQLPDPDPSHAFVWEDGVMTDLGTLGGHSSSARAINDAGEIVGWAWNSASQRAFLWTAEVGMTDLGDLGGEVSQALNINILGQIVGYSHTDEIEETIFIPFTHAFLWQDGEMYDLGVLPEAGEPGPYGPGLVHTSAKSINAAGQIVGNSWPARDTSPRQGPFIYDGGQMTNLNNLLVVGSAGWEIYQANDINNFGQIAGTASFDGGPQHAVRLDPVTVIPADLVVDGQVNAADLAVLLGSWGPCDSEEDCPADLDGDQVVGASDLAILLGSWGPYPA
ncbi:MAG: DUF3466 family protein [Planctomycetes bacterium]|nr:DUF3466 family protein [Planctomycetota bacterium]